MSKPKLGHISLPKVPQIVKKKFTRTFKHEEQNGEQIITTKKEETTFVFSEELVDFPEGYFYVKTLEGRVIEPQNLSLNPGTRIVVNEQRYGPDADSQLWSYDESGCLINKASGLWLDIEGGYVRTFHRTYVCQMEKKPPETAASQLWVVLAGGFISAADNGFVLEVRSDTSQLIMNNQDEKNKNQRWVFESERSLNNLQINHLELVESAYNQIQEQQNSVKFSQELVPGAAAFIAIQTWDEKCEIDGISAEDPRYKEYLAEKTGAEVTHFLNEESENMATLKASALSLAINAYKQKHSLHE